MVVLAHCENGRAIDLLTRQLVAQGRLGLDSLPRSRPIALEAECVHRFLALAEVAGATPYVVHVTGARPLAEIAAARRRGMPVYAEVCPHHLRFERAQHEGPDALRYVMTPPLRTAGDRAALLRGLRDGALDTYASDHCHLRLDRDKLPVAGDFTQVPTGLPGIGARLPLGFASAIDGEAPLSPERLVEVACAAPARIFGLYPQKGAIAPGSDADIVVWDPSQPSRLTLASIGDGLDWSPYDGVEVPGSIRHVLARGDRVVERRPLRGRRPPWRLPAGRPRLRGGLGLGPQYAIQPPSTRTFAPLMYVHSSEARKTASEATSSGWPRRGNGVRACE